MNHLPLLYKQKKKKQPTNLSIDFNSMSVTGCAAVGDNLSHGPWAWGWRRLMCRAQWQEFELACNRVSISPEIAVGKTREIRWRYWWCIYNSWCTHPHFHCWTAIVLSIRLTLGSFKFIEMIYFHTWKGEKWFFKASTYLRKKKYPNKSHIGWRWRSDIILKKPSYN